MDLQAWVSDDNADFTITNIWSVMVSALQSNVQSLDCRMHK